MRISYFLAVLMMSVSLPFGQAYAGPASTQYPIVFVPGLFGFKTIGTIDYWNDIPAALTADGAQVFTLDISPINTYEVRGEEVIEQIETILATTGATKVNLIGHSMGSPTIRYVAGVRPDLVASLTAVNGVVQGANVADLIVAGNSDLLYSVLELLTQAMVSASNTPYPTDVKAGMKVLTHNYMQQTFNPAFPNGLPAWWWPCGDGPEVVGNIRYYSMRGDQVFTNLQDPTDYVFGLTAAAYGPVTNDGLVGTCDQSIGKIIGTYHQNHLDMVKLMFGYVNVFEVNPTTVYRNHANRLKNLGL
jgi:triacylglycerol lipase